MLCQNRLDHRERSCTNSVVQRACAVRRGRIDVRSLRQKLLYNFEVLFKYRDDERSKIRYVRTANVVSLKPVRTVRPLRRPDWLKSGVRIRACIEQEMNDLHTSIAADR